MPPLVQTLPALVVLAIAIPAPAPAEDAARTHWWSLSPLVAPQVPKLAGDDARWARTPIDAFILAQLRQHGLAPAPQASRRTLIRRLYFDLWGLPPSPQDVDAFANDPAPDAYERLVDRLLASPRYGERWARHWLDVVHYGDTHGYDKDKRRPNAWPYRDYVIRAFNDDVPYNRFVGQQLAGDVLEPSNPDGVVATGFIVAGPWDFVGHAELREGTVDKKIARNLDRDDMVTNTMSTFTSLTVHCARCHDHKFDPITQEDYYSLQAVFAGVQRADRPYEPDARVAQQRLALTQSQHDLAGEQAALAAKIQKLAGPDLAAIDKRIDELTAAQAQKGAQRPEFGYHSAIETRQDAVKWVQVDLGKPTPIQHVVIVGCHDDFNNIGAGFGFPPRFRIEISDDPQFKTGVSLVADRTAADAPNPGVRPQSFEVDGKSARFIRVTATKLAPRQNDYIFALAELIALTPAGANAAAGAAVTSLDSIEAPVRWRRTNLVDGYYYGVGSTDHAAELADLASKRHALLDKVVDAETRAQMTRIKAALSQTSEQLSKLPAPAMVYAAAATFRPQGAFTPAPGGKPRPIAVLRRGSVTDPAEPVGPGAVSCVAGLSSRFTLANPDDEGQRRAALAQWIVDKRNPLTWRSIVNRVWLYHFGRAIVDTPNDFGRMGAMPTHPQLLDWLAAQFRDGNQSLKDLHRLILKSSVYRQSSVDNAAFARIDGGNRFLWRMNRTRLDAEAVRDTVLALAGKLDLTMFGPGYDLFGFKDDHSPHYLYEQADPDDPAGHRRAVYRFIVRSVPDPFMQTLDCADPSQIVPRRDETITALQALALLNDRFMVRMAEHFAAHLAQGGGDLSAQVQRGFRRALGREPSSDELRTLTNLAVEHGLPTTCRVIFNMNEFVFVD